MPTHRASPDEVAAQLVVARTHGVQLTPHGAVLDPSGREATMGLPKLIDPGEGAAIMTDGTELQRRALVARVEAAVEIELAAPLAAKMLLKTGAIESRDLRLVGAMAGEVVSGTREIERIVRARIRNVERLLRDPASADAIEDLAQELRHRGRLGADGVDEIVGERVRLGWSWWRKTAAAANPRTGSEGTLRAPRS